MEATSKTGLYSPKWKLVMEFDNSKLWFFWTPERLIGLLRTIMEECPWKDKAGNSLNATLEILPPVLHPEWHPDYGPEMEIAFEHRGLLLSQKQLWAYEEWARSIAGKLEDEISHTLQLVGLGDTIIWEVSMVYTAPFRRKAAESYRVSSKPGDGVRMPCGTLAVVTEFDILEAGHVKELTLRPVCGIFRHLWLRFYGRALNPVEEEIDKLTKVGEVPITEV